MTTLQLKKQLISKINSTDNEELLDQISRIIDLESKIDEVYELSVEETEAIKESIAQLDSGLFLSHEEANRQADKWLKK